MTNASNKTDTSNIIKNEKKSAHTRCAYGHYLFTIKKEENFISV